MTTRQTDGERHIVSILDCYFPWHDQIEICLGIPHLRNEQSLACPTNCYSVEECSVQYQRYIFHYHEYQGWIEGTILT